MSSLSLTMAFLMGLTGSLHCAGMCGPIVWVMPFQHLQGFKKFLGIFLYHFARTSVYVLLGLILLSFRGLFHPEWQRYISIVLGVLLLVAGSLAFLPGNRLKLNVPWAEGVKNLLGRFIGRPGMSTFFVTGALNGLLPCGMVYMALAASVATGTPLQVAGLLYSFGLGTVPMLVTITLLKSKLSGSIFQHLKRSVPVLMFIFGSLFVLRGMNLGIPYLSPRIEIAQQGTVTSTCCHRK